MRGAIPLGPFDLFEPVGRGGMGEVWRGVHRAQQIPVAVKFLTDDGVRKPFFLTAFRNEVRAMAGLDHPYIALVFDHGEVPAEATRISEGRLVAGSPYLAMELAPGGSLAPWCGKLYWREIREILVGLLDALAHAHARGVIHRDLKPGNVLLGDADSARSGIKLTDFGLAHLVERTDRPTALAPAGGTPYFMAPEQIASNRADYGPWTDLYSMGRLALSLLWGSPAPTEAQQAAGPPAPPGFGAWIARMLQPHPTDRFQRAADALIALLEVGDVPNRGVEAEAADVGVRLGISAETFVFSGAESGFSSSAGSTGVTGSSPRLVEQDAITLVGATPRPANADSSRAARSSALRSRDVAEVVAPPMPISAAPCVVRIPEMPDHWTRPAPPSPPMRLLGAGLGLYGLRAIPLIDREAERDILWSALAEVRHTLRPRVVLLQGPVGCGKSRLAEWICERAHEVGAANVVRATHSPLPGPADGLGPAVGRYLRTGGMSRGHILRRVEQVLRRQGVSDPDEWHALTELVSPATSADLEPGLRAVQFASPTERYVLVQRLLERLGRERPVLLWCDDVQWGLDALGFAAQLLDTAEDLPLPVRLVMTAPHETLAQRPAETGALEALRARDAVRHVEVGPLGTEHHAALVRGLLGLEGDLAAQVESRTAGNPLFAVQLVGDWVYRGLLVPGERGFKLKPGARVELPDLLHKVWATRVERVLAARTVAQGVALELAALLGQDVSTDEWRRACRLEGIEAPLELVEELLEQRLARSEEGPASGWSFVHGMLRESLERRARESGRWWSHHRACAAMLAELAGGPGATSVKVTGSLAAARLAERLGRHLLAAGDLEEAIAPLTRGVRARLTSGDYRMAEVLLVEREVALTQLGLPAADSRWGEGWLLRGRLARLRGQLDDAGVQVERAQVAARRFGWDRITAESLWELGTVIWNLGDADRAQATLEDAVAAAAALGDRQLLGQCRVSLASMLRRRGAREPAAAQYREALIDCGSSGDDVGEAYCHLGLGDIAWRNGDLGEARRAFERALAALERSGARRGVADCLNALGEVARLAGDYAEAEQRYRGSLARLQSIGSANSLMPECNLGLVLVERKRFKEAWGVLDAVLATIERQGPRVYRGNVHAYLLPCAASAGDWSAFDHHLAQAASLLAESGQVELDVARMTQKAGELAANRGQQVRAREAFELSLEQFGALSRADKVAEVRRELDALGAPR